MLTGRDGDGFVMNHYYDGTDEGAPRLNVRPLTWGADGWPLVGEPVNPSRYVGHGGAYVTIHSRDGGDAVVENVGCGYEGANVALWTDLGNLCQQWQVEDRGEGSRILNRFSDKVVEIAACDNTDGGNVALWGWVGFLKNNDCQRWDLGPGGDGWTTITSVMEGGRAWTVAGDPTAAANIAVSSPTGELAQHFRFDPVGTVILGSAADRTQTLGVRGCRADPGHGTTVRFEKGDADRCQTWRISAIGDTARYVVVNDDSGKLLSSKCHGRSRDDLRVVEPRRADERCITWTLVPGDEGTWTLANPTTTQEVRLLVP